MKKFSFGVIGVGLIGGSFSLSIREQELSTKILGLDLDKNNLSKALELNIIDQEASLEEILQVDILILAIPVRAIKKMISLIDDNYKKMNKDIIIIDFGSTKKDIADSIPDRLRENFVLTHPMTGTEFSGPEAAVHNLFKNKTIVFSDVADTNDIYLDRALSIFETLNMNIKYMSSEDHDKHAAYISHLPHLISFSISNSILKKENKYDILSLSSGGFESISRLAKSSPIMWEEIFRDNKTNVLEALENFNNELNLFKKNIEDDNWEDLNKQMVFSNTLYELFGKNK